MKRKLIYSLTILTALYILGFNFVFANVQARPGNAIFGSNHDGYLKAIRNMESPNNVLGLNATIDGNCSETTPSNNIDAHMIKQTEYGAVVTLINSQYGVKISNIAAKDDLTGTSTLNATGIYTLKSGYRDGNGFAGYFYHGFGLAAGVGEQANLVDGTIFKLVKSRYINLYDTEGTTKPGDASEYYTRPNSNTRMNFVYNSVINAVVYHEANDGSYAVIVNGAGV